MAFKRDYSKDELQEIIKDNGRYAKELENSFGLVLNGFEKHQVFPSKEMVLKNLSAGHLPFLFKNYFLEKEEIVNIKMLYIKAKNNKIYSTQNKEVIASSVNLNSLELESVSDLADETIEKIKDVQKIENQDLSVSGVLGTLKKGLPAIFSSEVHDLDFLNEMVQHKDFYDVSGRTDEDIEDEDIEDEIRENTESFVVNLVNSLDINQFNSLSVDTLKKINFYLVNQDYGNSFISEMLKTTTYLKKKYSFDDYFNVRDVKDSVLMNISPDEAYEILGKAYANEKAEKVEDLNNSKKKVPNPLISLYNSAEVWGTVRNIKNLDKEKINAIFENNFIPTWDENVPEDKLAVIRKKLIRFSEYGVSFDTGSYPFLPEVVLPLIFNKEFSDEIYSHAKGRRDAFDLNSKDLESKIPESIIQIMRHQVPASANDTYPDGFQDDLAALFGIIKNRGVYDDSQKALYYFSIETMKSNPLMSQFEFASPIVEQWRKEGYFAYNDIREAFIEKYSEPSADNFLILIGAGFQDKSKEVLQALNPADVVILKNILKNQNDNINLDDITGTEGAPISISENAPYKRMPKNPGYHCADLLMYSGDNFFEQIKKPEFKMSGDFAVRALLDMRNKSSDEVELFTFWMGENFKKYPEELPNFENTNIKDLFSKYNNLRGFVKVKDYTYDDIMQLNAEFINVDQATPEGKEKGAKLKSEFSTIPENVVNNFIANYVKRKDWKKQSAPLLNQSVLRGYAYYNNELDYPDLLMDTNYIRSGITVPVLTKDQVSMFWASEKLDLSKGNSYSVSKYEIEHLMQTQGNAETLFDVAYKQYPIFFMSKDVRILFEDKLNTLGDEKLADLFHRAVKAVDVKELKPLFGGNSSEKPLNVGEEFWEILSSKEYSFQEKFVLNEVASSFPIKSMNVERLRENIQYVLDVNGFELTKAQEELLESKDFGVYSTFGTNLLFPEMFDMKYLERNKDEFNKFTATYHVTLYKFDFEIHQKINGEVVRSKKNTNIDFDFSEKVGSWMKLSELSNAFNESFSSGIKLFANSLEQSNSSSRKLNLSSITLLNDANFNEFMNVMSGEVNITLSRQSYPNFIASLKELVVSSIVSDELGFENKLMLAEINQSMILSEKYFYGSEDNLNYYTKEVLLSQEVTSTLAAFTLKEKIQTRFDNFSTKVMDEDDDLSCDNGFKL